jgi:hypothetical protein
VVKSTRHLLKHKLARQDNGGQLRLEEGESGEDLNSDGGGRGEGAGVWHGPSEGRGSSRRGTGADPTAVGEAIGATLRRSG